tara:strand:+ start:289 stop:1077 length:789 start_codon:yes stop_codon:yes gene_type:complete
MSRDKKLKTKEYRLTDDRSGLAVITKTGKDKKRRLMVWDEEKKISRPIRHCPSEPSIFMDEQSEFAYVVPIVFMHGYLEVPKEQQITQRFLDNHPDNFANGGNWFEEVNDEKESETELDLAEMKVDIYNAIRERAEKDDGAYALEAVVAVLEDSVVVASEMGMKSLKRRIYQEIESNPFYFVDDDGDVTVFEDDYINRKYFVLRAIKEAVIKKSPTNKSMVWVRDNKTIATAPRGVELTDFFTDFLATEDGMLVAEEIKKRS